MIRKSAHLVGPPLSLTILFTYGRDPKFYNRALLHCCDEKVILAFSRRLLVGRPTSPRSSSLPSLTEAQAEAIDAIHYIAKKHEIVTSTQKGDMRFINNMGIVHSREKFVETESMKRYLSGSGSITKS